MYQIDSNKKYIVRTYSAGVFFCNIRELTDSNAVVYNTRRIWHWDGAASLTQLALEGVKNPKNCKFTMTIEDDVFLPQVIEVIPCTATAVSNINDVKVWKI